MKNKLPILGITMGDPSSIGPEIAVKAMLEKSIYDICRPLLVGDAKVIEQIINILGYEIGLNIIHKAEDAKFSFGVIDIYDLDLVNIDLLKLGEVSAMAGNAAFQTVKTVIELAISKKIDGTVTGPLNKESINKAGHHFSGHTEIYAHFTNTKKYAMLLVDENLKVIHVSTHVSLRKACEMVRKERILDVVKLLNDALKKLGYINPRIGIAGLNPHASDGGLFGDEEEKEIIPAVNEARNNGFNVEGPVPADTLFSKVRGGHYDGCVAMYHDQGHIPFKLEGFIWDNEKQNMKSVKGVNITLGLPIIRTSVDHGTAFEIAGKGIASCDAMLLAIEYAAKMFTNYDVEN